MAAPHPEAPPRRAMVRRSSRAPAGRPTRRRSSASRPRAAGSPCRRPRAARRARGPSSRRRRAIRGAGRGCRRCAGAGSGSCRASRAAASSAALPRWTISSSGAPRCGVPSETTWRTCRTHSAPASAAWCAALRATRPPIECPIERDVVDLDRPVGDGALEQLRQRASVLGDPAAGVVADVDRRPAAVVGEPAAVVRSPAPRELRLHQAVQEDGDSRSVGERLHAHGAPSMRIAIGLRELVPFLGERVADQAVDDRDARRPARRTRRGAACTCGRPPPRARARRARVA